MNLRGDRPSGVRRLALERVLDPLDVVIEFKRDVYQMALTELRGSCRAAPSTTAICAPGCGRTIGKTCLSVGPCECRQHVDDHQPAPALKPAVSAPAAAPPGASPALGNDSIG